jgi:hypothetical protein
VDAVRDLGRDEPWQQSLERSRARRSKSRPGGLERPEPPRERRLAQRRPSGRRSPRGRPAAERRKAGHWWMVAIGAVTFAVAFQVSVLPSAHAGGGARKSVIAAGVSAPVHPAYADLGSAGLLSRWLASPAVGVPPTHPCQPTSGSSDYVNPLARARVTPERIDQGVDYAGSGTLTAIGTATITHVATGGTGWPGAFIEYRLLDGPDAGCFVYYAEGVAPAAGLRVGAKVAAGQAVATIIPSWETGIELGWGAGSNTGTYAARTHEWSARSDEDDIPSASGKIFSALIASLGGPPGKVEG